MARLPQPGSDQGTWGDILNDYLAQVHNPDGTLRPDIITETHLAPVVVDKINVVAGQQGATGPSGPQGLAGATGATGAQGASGVAGAAGTAGLPGSTGATGAIGQQGATGASGTQGPAGATGASGVPGTAGQQGATGVTGPQGPAGQDGTSVTIAGAVANAAALPTGLGAGDAGDGYITNDDGHLHVWSGSSWTDVGAVRGPVGATGPTGAAGSAGPAGATGATGQQGATGPSGTQGPAGATGAAGASSWNSITDKPAVIAAGADATTARAAIGAGTSSLVIGTTSGTAAAGNHTHSGMVTATTLTGLWQGTQAQYDALGTYDDNVLYFIKDAG